ncbi:hypothetical protein RLG99_02340, partial [Streptococcus pneumoniae]|nr:hypothetical protein [Streptococcus pneumoniae]
AFIQSADGTGWYYLKPDGTLQFLESQHQAQLQLVLLLKKKYSVHLKLGFLVFSAWSICPD